MIIADFHKIKTAANNRSATSKMFIVTLSNLARADAGADWQTIFADGLAELDTRYAIETDDGATIEVVNYGFRHGPPEVIAAIGRGEKVAPDQYYMRTHARLETGDAQYAWMNNLLFVGVGAREASTVVLKLYAIK